MRLIPPLLAAFILLISGPAVAQEWDEYVNMQDGFKVNFPGQPTVTETTWKSQMDYMLPARVYSADRGREHYSVTVVDYSGLEQQGIERSKTCPPGNQQCRENAGPILGPGYWKHDERGAIVYATFKLLQRDARLTGLAWEWQDLVEGHFYSNAYHGMGVYPVPPNARAGLGGGAGAGGAGAGAGGPAGRGR